MRRKGWVWPFWAMESHWSCANNIGLFPPRDYYTFFKNTLRTDARTQYLCQPDILLLNGVLQTVAEGSGQQQICGLADHIVYLRGTEDIHTHTHTQRQQQRISDCAKTISSILEILHLKASTNSLSEFLSLQISPFGKSLNVSQFKWAHYHVIGCQAY